jgi:glutathione S-transferase
MSDKIVFGYWGIRGLGQVARLLLAYSGLAWEDHKYLEKEKWFDKDKKELGFAFPNLPYLIDGDFKLTESRAINLYVIKKSGKTDLLGKNLKD